MKTGTFRLNSDFLLKEAAKRGRNNAHQISMRSGISSATVYKLLNHPSLFSIELGILDRLLTHGIGFSIVEMEALKFTDLFVHVGEVVR